MRLVELYANRESFKRVRFNDVGISLIMGSRQDASSVDNDNKSYNGVGKSLLVEIVHFCLGSNSNKAFKEHLPGWEFHLVFTLKGRLFHVIRSTDKQGEVLLNEEVLKLKAFNEVLEKGTFEIPAFATGGQLSFRSLIPRFIRRTKADYNDPKVTSSDREPYTTLLRNVFLLGLDISLVEKKYNLRSRQVQVEQFEKNFKADPFIKEYYTGNKDASLQAKLLQEQVDRYVADLEGFRVAEDYYEIEKVANRLASELRELKNKKIIYESSVENIKRSMETRGDISLDKIKVVYGELLSSFKAEALKSLSDVENFHKKILSNRLTRLSQERRKAELEISAAAKAIAEKGAELDRKLSYLSDKRALDQYAAVSAQLSDSKAKLQKLLDYQQLLHKSREEAAQIKLQLAEENLKANEYLDETELERSERLSIFSELAREFYPDSPCGITLGNNSGENKVRYDFDVRIEADGSDGINAVKLFCYDLSVAYLRSNHDVRFIWHDSRLFSDIDPRQRAILFKVAAALSEELGFQYIASVNEDQLNAVRPLMDDEDYDLLSQKVVLKLDDRGPEGKVLGVQVDMHYES
ncbi:DUF2326 domain-containing protein [Pseudomonas sp. GD03944]|uniref:DUF2326 domain-containing protein n=1 Tax=Pseudomonas sp. GD03944 TaxID=2975409 RepID=UPI00244B4363|nr:DUF2326 domain-containing protein [Pseudomonas sp. GD03944]MDH1264664.1 DUF2326 domain-containing protein [Pseudomonas sp. GD03944]